jgi:hypothetical protein
MTALYVFLGICVGAIAAYLFIVVGFREWFR